MEHDKTFITLLFHNKGIDLINLPHILNNKLATKTIPLYFKTKKPPCVSYKYTHTTANAIFNHKEVCHSFQANINPIDVQCHCSAAEPCYKHDNIGHVITGNLDIVDNLELKNLLKKGPKFRIQNNINWKKNHKLISEAIEQYIRKWAKREDVEVSCLKEYKEAVMKLVNQKITSLKKIKTHHPNVLDKPRVRDELNRLKQSFVLAPADKATNNVIIICKKWYLEQMCNELNLTSNKNNTSAYQIVKDKINLDIVQEHQVFNDTHKLPKLLKEPGLPIIYGLPKMHKTIPKLRYISASCNSSIKGLDKLMTRCLAAVHQAMIAYCQGIKRYSGFHRMWILDNSQQLKEYISLINAQSDAVIISTWDFSTLYTTIPHNKLKTEMGKLLQFVFKFKKSKHISVKLEKAFFSNKEYKGYKSFSPTELIYFLEYLIDNIYVVFGDTLHKQIVGIPMGMCCAPLLANLFLMSYEYRFMEVLEKENPSHARLFGFTFRYIDDLISVNNPVFESYLQKIYPAELSITKENTSDHQASYLDLSISIESSKFHTKLYDKRDDFSFEIVNYPFPIASNIPKKPAYGVYASRIIAFARACDHYNDFSARHSALCATLLKQGYRYRLLVNQLRKTFGKHTTLFAKYNRPVGALVDDVPLPAILFGGRKVTRRR